MMIYIFFFVGLIWVIFFEWKYFLEDFYVGIVSFIIFVKFNLVWK